MNIMESIHVQESNVDTLMKEFFQTLNNGKKSSLPNPPPLEAEFHISNEKYHDEDIPIVTGKQN